MSDHDTSRIQDVPQASLEHASSTMPGYNHVVLLTQTGTGTLQVSNTFQELVSSALEGMGTVNLVALKVKYNFTAAKQFIKVGVVSSLAAKSIDIAVRMSNGHVAWSNEYTYGAEHVYDIVVPSIFSRQIQPISSERVMPKLMLSASAGVSVALEIHLMALQPVMHFLTFP